MWMRTAMKIINFDLQVGNRCHKLQCCCVCVCVQWNGWLHRWMAISMRHCDMTVVVATAKKSDLFRNLSFWMATGATASASSFDGCIFFVFGIQGQRDPDTHTKFRFITHDSMSHNMFVVRCHSRRDAQSDVDLSQRKTNNASNRHQKSWRHTDGTMNSRGLKTKLCDSSQTRERESDIDPHH